jgi:hypothetical protein
MHCSALTERGEAEITSVNPMRSRYALVPPALNTRKDPMACMYDMVMRNAMDGSDLRVDFLKATIVSKPKITRAALATKNLLRSSPKQSRHASVNLAKLMDSSQMLQRGPT